MRPPALFIRSIRVIPDGDDVSVHLDGIWQLQPSDPCQALIHSSMNQATSAAGTSSVHDPQQVNGVPEVL